MHHLALRPARPLFFGVLAWSMLVIASATSASAHQPTLPPTNSAGPLPSSYTESDRTKGELSPLPSTDQPDPFHFAM